MLSSTDGTGSGRPRGFRSALTLAATVTLVCAATGCGAASDSGAGKSSSASSSPGSSPAATAPGSTTEKAASGAPIKVMTIGNWTQPTAGTANPEYPAGAQAAAMAINAAGGIDGRPIDVIVCSDQLDPNVARNCANQAISDKVAAVVGLQTINASVVYPLLQRANIPMVGVVPFSSQAFTTNDSFSDTGGQLAEDSGAIYALKKAGAHKIVWVLPSGLESGPDLNAIKQAAARNGLGFAGVIEIPPKQSDLSAIVASATSRGADGVFGFGFDEAAFIQAFRQGAPNVHLATTTFNLTPQVIKSLGSQADGIYLAPNTVPYTAKAAGVEQYRADLHKYFPKLPLSQTGLHEWMSMETFARVMKSAKTVDPSSVIAAYQQIRNLSMGGITPPYSTAPKGTGEFARMFNRTAYLAVVKNQALEPVNPNAPFVQSFVP